MHPILAVVAAEGGFNPLDVSGGGGFVWTLIIFAVSIPISCCIRSMNATRPDGILIEVKSPRQSSTPSASCCFWLRRASMRCSILSEHTRFMTLTGRV